MHCPNCNQLNTLWPEWNGRCHYYRCEHCHKAYSDAQLKRAKLTVTEKNREKAQLKIIDAWVQEYLRDKELKLPPRMNPLTYVCMDYLDEESNEDVAERLKQVVA